MKCHKIIKNEKSLFPETPNVENPDTHFSSLFIKTDQDSDPDMSP